MNYLSLIAAFVFFIFSMRASADTDQLLELFSEEELVEMAGYGEEKLSTVFITGSVLCESSCLQSPHTETQHSSRTLSGALVGVACSDKTTTIESNSTQANGEFLIDLPSHFHAIPDLETRCWVELLRVPDSSSCRPAYVKLKKRITISSTCDGTRTYDAGTIKLLDSLSKPLGSCIDRGKEPEVVEPTR